MQIVIDIDEKDFYTMVHNFVIDNPLCPISEKEIVAKVAKGTPLPKEHESRNTDNYITQDKYVSEDIKERIEYYVNKDIKALLPVTPAQRWIPVSERLPEERGVYIVTEKVFSIDDRKHTRRFNLMTEQAEFHNGKWRRASFYEVIAWMPLPEPYKAESEVGNGSRKI